MKYEKPVVAAVAAVKAIQGTGGTTKNQGFQPDQLDVRLAPTIGAYEADE